MSRYTKKPNLKIDAVQDTRPVQLTDTLDVRRTFLQLTHRTCPHGYEEMYEHALLERGFYKDEFGNYWQHVGEPQTHRIMFAAHLDTVGSMIQRVKHQFSDNGRTVKSAKKTILGADDKAGVSILLYMLAHEVPGTYALFVGEECGCIGSREAAGALVQGMYDAVISFDRAGHSDVITHQGGIRTASDAFAEALSKQLNAVYENGFEYKPCDGGVYTDSNEFRSVVPECTNVSVGYHGQHGNNESQDLLWLECLALACRHVDWQGLPIERDPSVTESKWSTRTWGYSSAYWDDYDHPTTSRKDANVDRVLSGESSTVSYMEARYGIKLMDWSLEDMLELGDALTEEEWEIWVVCNPEKVRMFLQYMAYDFPQRAQSYARLVDKENL